MSDTRSVTFTNLDTLDAKEAIKISNTLTSQMLEEYLAEISLEANQGNRIAIVSELMPTLVKEELKKRGFKIEAYQKSSALSPIVLGSNHLAIKW